MQLVDQEKRSNQEEQSQRLYAALVDSMCQNFWPLFFGGVCAASAALMTAVKTGNVLLWPIAFLIVAIGTARAFQMRKYERRTSVLTYEQAKQWEPRYAVGAIFYAGVLGAWCFITILGSDDPIAHMVCVAVTIGYTAGGAARNYGRPKLIQLHILFACGPMSLALAVHGGFYYIGLSVLLVLFFIGLKHLNIGLNAMFVNALTSSFREAALAGQFDTALNNMPHGLCMFAADGHLAVMNHRFSEMMNLSDDLVHSGASAPDIVAACVSAGSISDASARIILSEIENSQAKDVITTDPDLVRARSLSWTFQPMAGGGAVVLARRHHRAAQRGSQNYASGALRRTHRASQPGQFPQRDRTPADGPARCRAIVGVAVHRPRSVQAGQRHAWPSLRRPVVVRRRRQAARDAAPGGLRRAVRR